MIGFDPTSEKELCKIKSEGFFSTYVSEKLVVFQDKKVLLGD